jgi:hypothetical protein
MIGINLALCQEKAEGGGDQNLNSKSSNPGDVNIPDPVLFKCITDQYPEYSTGWETYLLDDKDSESEAGYIPQTDIQYITNITCNASPSNRIGQWALKNDKNKLYTILTDFSKLDSLNSIVLSYGIPQVAYGLPGMDSLTELSLSHFGLTDEFYNSNNRGSVFSSKIFNRLKKLILNNNNIQKINQFGLPVIGSLTHLSLLNQSIQDDGVFFPGRCSEAKLPNYFDLTVYNSGLTSSSPTNISVNSMQAPVPGCSSWKDTLKILNMGVGKVNFSSSGNLSLGQSTSVEVLTGGQYVASAVSSNTPVMDSQSVLSPKTGNESVSTQVKFKVANFDTNSNGGKVIINYPSSLVFQSQVNKYEVIYSSIELPDCSWESSFDGNYLGRNPDDISYVEDYSDVTCWIPKRSYLISPDFDSDADSLLFGEDALNAKYNISLDVVNNKYGTDYPSVSFDRSLKTLDFKYFYSENIALTDFSNNIYNFNNDKTEIFDIDGSNLSKVGNFIITDDPNTSLVLNSFAPVKCQKKADAGSAKEKFECTLDKTTKNNILQIIKNKPGSLTGNKSLYFVMCSTENCQTKDDFGGVTNSIISNPNSFGRFGFRVYNLTAPNPEFEQDLVMSFENSSLANISFSDFLEGDGFNVYNDKSLKLYFGIDNKNWDLINSCELPKINHNDSLGTDGQTTNKDQNTYDSRIECKDVDLSKYKNGEKVYIKLVNSIGQFIGSDKNFGYFVIREEKVGVYPKKTTNLKKENLRGAFYPPKTITYSNGIKLWVSAKDVKRLRAQEYSNVQIKIGNVIYNFIASDKKYFDSIGKNKENHWEYSNSCVMSADDFISFGRYVISCPKPSLSEAGSPVPNVNIVVTDLYKHKINFDLGVFEYVLGSNLGNDDLKEIEKLFSGKIGGLVLTTTPLKKFGGRQVKQLPAHNFMKSQKLSYQAHNLKISTVDKSGKVKGLRVGVSYISVKINKKQNVKARVTVKLPKVKTYKNNFKDIKKENKEFQNYIKWMYNYGVTTGVDSKHYAPASPVRRDQMAAFIHRLVGNPDFKLSSAKNKKVKKFVDMPKGVFGTSVKFLLNDSITTGTTSITYSPAGSVTRMQMALFMYRLAKSNGVDVKKGISTKNVYHVKDWNNRWGKEYKLAVNWLLKTKVSTQKNTTYWPNQPVRRDQMAAFMSRLYNNVLIK